MRSPRSKRLYLSAVQSRRCRHAWKSASIAAAGEFGHGLRLGFRLDGPLKRNSGVAATPILITGNATIITGRKAAER
jgi:hypothetical protein